MNKFKFGIILGLLILIYIAFFSIITIQRHRNLNSSYYDLAIMDQTAYNTYKGRILELTDPQGTTNFKRMAIHNDIVLVLLAPFYFIYEGPETLLIIQSIILALGAIPLYLLSLKVLNSKRLGLAIAFSYLIYPALQNANLYDFHAVTLATSFLIFMVYFIYVKRHFLSLVFFGLAVLSKEQVALSTAIYGFYLLFKRKELNEGRKEVFIATTIVLLSISWFILSIWVIIPYFRQGPHFALFRYKNLGDTLASIITGFLLNPQIFFQQVLSTNNLKYFYQLLAPLAFLPLFAPGYFPVLLPELAINLLSSHEQMRTIDYHYTSVITAFIFIAAIFGSKYLLSKFKSSKLKKLIVILILIGILMNRYYGIGLYSKSKHGNIGQYFKVRPERNAVELWQKTLRNEDIAVSVSENLGPHFSRRKVFYRFSGSYKKADYVLLLTDNIYNDWLNKKDSIKSYNALKKDSNFKLIYKQYSLEVYEKVI